MTRSKSDSAITGLGRTEVRELGPRHLGLIKRRKSRIIMKDGEKLLLEILNLRRHHPDARMSLLTNAPVCSKTRAFLAEKGIDILPLGDS